MEGKRKGTTGTASVVATTPLKRIPIFMKSPRRESVFSFNIMRLLLLCVIRNGIRLARVQSALRCEPSNYVGNFLVGHRLAGCVSAPVRCSQFGTAGDNNGAQPLIAHQREKGIIVDSAPLLSPATSGTMSAFALSLIIEI